MLVYSRILYDLLYLTSNVLLCTYLTYGPYYALNQSILFFILDSSIIKCERVCPILGSCIHNLE